MDQSPNICLPLALLLIAGTLWLPTLNASESGDPIEAYLLKGLDENPSHADSWRLLGRVYQKRGDIAGAKQAFQKSLDNDPYSAAALFDYGQVIADEEGQQAAFSYFQKVYEIAPESDYAKQLRELGIPEPQQSSEAINAVYEVLTPEEILQTDYQIQRFDESENLERRNRELNPVVQTDDDRFRFFLETGVLYNTNVTLAPISRQLSSIDAKSFQGFLAPEAEWIAYQGEKWRTGPLFRGYFTLNEENFKAFNLSSFQPGAFLERDLEWWGATHIQRFEYTQSHDFFDGEKIGLRHSATASITTILPSLDALYWYVTPSYSTFDAPVANPSQDSLDGFGLTFGMSRFFRTSLTWLPTWSLGPDLEWINTEGDNYRYFGAKVHADATIRLRENLDFIPSGNIGFRAYPDYASGGDRDELAYRLSSRLRYRWSDHISTSLVLNYDRFASGNPNFDAERFETGFVTTLLY